MFLKTTYTYNFVCIVDCGLFVCYIMRQCSNHEPISLILLTQDVRLMRTEIIERFVTEVGWSWTEPIQIPLEEIQKV